MLKIKTYKPDIFPDLIERIWIAENIDEPAELIIPPDQYVNLILPLCNSSYQHEKDVVYKPQIEGISLKNTSLVYAKNTKLIGIRFYAFGIYPFTRLSGKLFINKSTNFMLAPEKITEITECGVYVSEQALLQRIYDLLTTLYSERFYESIKPLLGFYKYYRWNDETSSIEEYCSKNGTNYTTLNRRFSEVVGISPKKFERLIKFRKSLCRLIDSNESLTSISANSGYFDQAHFIREFKIFLNHTPSSYQSLIKMAYKESNIINYNFRLL